MGILPVILPPIQRKKNTENLCTFLSIHTVISLLCIIRIRSLSRRVSVYYCTSLSNILFSFSSLSPWDLFIASYLYISSFSYYTTKSPSSSLFYIYRLHSNSTCSCVSTCICFSIDLGQLCTANFENGFITRSGSCANSINPIL